MEPPRSAGTPLRTTQPGPLIAAAPGERTATVAGLAVGLAAAAWTLASPATRDLDALVRAVAAAPAFALGFGIVMVGMAAASDVRSGGRR